MRTPAMTSVSSPPARRRISAEEKWSVVRHNVVGVVEGNRQETTSDEPEDWRWLVGWRDSFNRPSVKALLDLKRSISTANAQWIRRFLEHNGVERLLQVFQSLYEQASPSFVDTLLQLSCVGCIRAVMNSRTGLEYIIENKEFVNKFAFGK